MSVTAHLYAMDCKELMRDDTSCSPFLTNHYFVSARDLHRSQVA
jgi:hypothetical protein